MDSKARSTENIALCMRTLRDILAELGPKTPLQPGMKNLLKALAENMGYKRAFLAIFDQESDTLRIGLTYTQPTSSQADYTPGQGVIGQVFESGSSIVVSRMKDHPEFLNRAFGRSTEELSSLAFISVPVIAVNSESREVLGTLSVDLPTQPREILEANRQFLEVVAGLIANQAALLQEEMALQRHLMAHGMGLGSEEPYPHMPNIVATSKTMRMVLQQVSQVGPSRATALIRGESGTGKELLAEAIHAASPRADQPLVKLNCAALPADLIESELFGHEKGAFTGAVSQKKGMFEQADKGTLFLDEIGELSLEAQAKVLRAIQEKEIQRLGSEQTITVDTRLICATHRPLEDLLQEGNFREDLYYRVNVFPVFIPPLRERRDDILPMAEHFLDIFSKEYAKKIKRISTPAIDLLTSYHWPGNVRELRNCMERATLICDEDVIRSYHLPPSLQSAESSATDTDLSFGEAVAKFEQEILVDALKKAKGNMLQAARDLRVSYRIVNYKVKKYRIDPKKYGGQGKKKRSQSST
ncbi:sigma 54-interacting transcriptional regulator [Desulfohalovibrio reitneri]|uniref:sigma 54-interacting transcriptional regulator n=1 Tax=Desulfohalovibrio reitneri TaxID=1307759 RepID=UPI0004A74156|nr:sigma 54-interacting transcriptional regulator [Desulfohalovibrio reitneri]